MNGFDMGNHTIDHLESVSTWSGIPAKYKDPMTGSWKQSADGNYGPRVLMDQSHLGVDPQGQRHRAQGRLQPSRTSPASGRRASS
jgi:hypothetical protein